VIQDPGDSGESCKTFARIKIEQSQNPRYGARCVASRPLSQGEAIVRLSGALTRQSYRTIQIDKYRHLEEPRILAFLITAAIRRFWWIPAASWCSRRGTSLRGRN
jgi:hypothetical protein